MPTSKYSVFPTLFSFLIFQSEAAPIYSSHYCTSSDQTNSTFQTNLNLLLSSLSSKASDGNHFCRTRTGNDTPNAVNGLLLCRGDTLTAVYHECVSTAAREIKRRCPVEKEAIIWYDVCMLRYSNQSFNNIVPWTDLSDSTSVAAADIDRFNELLAGMLNALATKASNSQNEKFATNELNFTSSQTLFGLVQCTPDLTVLECTMCFRSAIVSVPNCCDGKRGARVLLPGCNIRYEHYPFFNSTPKSLPPAIQPHPSRRSHVLVILEFVILIVASLVLFIFGFCSFVGQQAKNMIILWKKTNYSEV